MKSREEMMKIGFECWTIKLFFMVLILLNEGGDGTINRFTSA